MPSDPSLIESRHAVFNIRLKSLCTAFMESDAYQNYARNKNPDEADLDELLVESHLFFMQFCAQKPDLQCASYATRLAYLSLFQDGLAAMHDDYQTILDRVLRQNPSPPGMGA